MNALARAVALLGALLAGCESAGGDDFAAGPTPATQFVELGPDGIRSPFTKESVLRLNAIVQRSLDVIRDYDGSIAEIRRLVDTAAKAGATPGDKADAANAVARAMDYSSRASAARAAMDVAVADLKSGGEPYNEAILAGMIAFVERVDDEIRAEASALRALVNA